MKLNLVIAFITLALTVHIESANGYKNILFIVADDLGWSDLGYGNSDVLTPNIDKLANDGVIFNQSYVYPLCTPTRGSLMTGTFAEYNGLQHFVIQPQDPVGLPDKYTLMPEMFKRFGYATHMVGKWHLGSCNVKYTPAKRGFDSFYGYFAGATDYYTHRVQTQGLFAMDGLDYWNQTADKLEPVKDQGGIYSMYSYTERAIDIIENHDKKKPLFLYYASQVPHDPLQVPQKYKDLYSNVKDDNRRTYLGMVSALDEAVGNLTDTLSKQGMLDDTLIFFTSDNGGLPRQSGYNWPLRGAKSTIYEGGTRVRGFVNGKGLESSVYSGMMHAVDWLPTMLQAAIGKPVDISGIDGVSQWSALTKNLDSPRTSFIYNIDPLGVIGCFQPTEAIRYKKWKLIVGCPGLFTRWYQAPDSSSRASDQPNLYDNEDAELYDIEADPLEKENVASKYPAVVRNLRNKLEEYKKKSVEPLLPKVSPPNPKANPKNFDDTWAPGWC